MSIGTNTKTEKYNPERIELIKLNLEQHYEAGNPREYEIQVDGLKAVWRTGDVKQFDNHQLYLTEDAEKMKILLFQGTSHKYDSFVFLLNNAEPQQSLQGLPLTVDEKIHQALRDKELNDAKIKIEELQNELDEALEYQEKLEDKIHELESNKTTGSDKMMNVITNLGELMMRSPKALKGVPLIGEALAGGMENKLAEENQAMKQHIDELTNIINTLGYGKNPDPNQTSFKEKITEES
ncbi:MAG: hypothetical protein JNM95_12090 [Chitinophagaceae bacterium]|nr:hypothetical protein [Chitinophagaceae bacterium]